MGMQADLQDGFERSAALLIKGDAPWRRRHQQLAARSGVARQRAVLRLLLLGWPFLRTLWPAAWQGLRLASASID